MKYLRKMFVTSLFAIAILVAGSTNVYAKEKVISFEKKQITMYTKTSHKVKVKIGANKYKNRKIVYSSSNKKIAKINKSGVIKAKKKGIVNVYAKIKGTSKKAKCKIKVLQGIKNINITSPTKDYYVGSKYQLQVIAKPFEHDEKIKWKSSDKNIVRVNQKGLIKIKKEGNVTIKAYGTKTKNAASISIEAKELPRMEFAEGKKKILSTGQQGQLNVRFVNKIWKQYTYSSVDNTIVTVTAQGKITAIRPGQAYIKATTIDGTDTAAILVIVQEKNGFITDVMLNNLELADRTNLMIVAHPDDETLWGGAHLKEGKWFVVCLTNQYTKHRKDEYKKVIAEAGAKGIILDYPDIFYKLDKKWDKDNWIYVSEGVYNDVLKVISYKEWNLIVTHSSTGETGHRQHIKTDQAVTTVCKLTGTFDRLWYFGKFYNKGQIPADLPKITEEQLEFKQSLLDMYVREQSSINAYWVQMNPYENWVKATEYK